MLIDRIRNEIRDSGPMPFDRFMELSLYDPEHGYFSSEVLRSDRQGDFLTSPEVSPLFGEAIGRFCFAERERIGEPFAVVEAGAGSGSLLQPLLRVCPAEAYAVEVSPGAKGALAERIPSANVLSSIEGIPGEFRGVIVANELLDNLPAAVAVRRGGSWSERVVVAGSDGLEYAEAEARPEVRDWADRHAGEVPEGSLVEVQIAARDWLQAALTRVAVGSVLVFDYGDDAEGLASRRAEGTMRTYRGHHLGPDPLLEPGSTDLTCDVDFGALGAAARDAGYEPVVTTQAEFLEEWGLRGVLADLRDRELAAAREGDVMEQMMLKSARTGGETLMHPRGLGDFRALVVRVG